MLHIIGIKNCDTITKTKKWFKNKGIDFELIDVRESPLSVHELSELEYKVGLDVILNRRSATYRELGLAKQNLNNKQLLEALHEHQTMIKRPVLAYEDSVLVGYDEEAFENFALEHNLLES